MFGFLVMFITPVWVVFLVKLRWQRDRVFQLIFGKDLRHIESMTSKVQSSADYWIDDVKMPSKVQPAADYWTVAQKKTWGQDCVIFGEQKNKEGNDETPLRTGSILNE